MRMREGISRRNMLRTAIAAAVLSSVEKYYRDPILEVLRSVQRACEKGLSEPTQPIRLRLMHPGTASTVEIDAFAYQKGAQNIDYTREQRQEKHLNQLSAGTQTYVISEITEADLISRDFADCIGSVFVGQDRLHPGRRLAFGMHTDPGKVLTVNRAQFVRDFEQRIAEFYSRVDPHSIAYSFFGGKYDHRPYKEGLEASRVLRPYDDDRMSELYLRALALQAEIALKYIPGIQPSVIVGPNTYPVAIHMRFHTNAGPVSKGNELAILSAVDLAPGYSVCSMRAFLLQMEEKMREREHEKTGKTTR